MSPNWSKTEFADTDLVMSVQVVNDPNAGYVARATYCEQEFYFGIGRPISGVVQLNLA